ncbi:alpha/beta fold hydrolase [Pararobbsia silviterrae]|uniref:Alpha/beta hydrolase n=1 Tax=Pararobbsia silviterrae TaxID=1792498 RepID=A0A494XZJ7_9BURK|nr:alpha/beta hydrolase [Pararobbsia silviterrae]RKP55942.1 alpha/beta hydrolase [Pararobbsia silviterrae]
MSTWILLRGLTRETRHWGAFAPTFERIVGAADPDARCIPIELPGNGDANAERTPAQVAEIVASVRATAARIAPGTPYRVLAMSLGGMVATAWAQRHPDDIERLVLINTSMRPLCGVTQRLRPAAWPHLVSIIARWRRADACENAIHALTCNADAQRAHEVAVWAEIRRSRPVASANALRQLLAAARFVAERAPPRCPALILSAARDRLVDPVCSARIAKHWGAAHLEHPRAGHDLPHDDPVWTSEAVRDWLGWARDPASRVETSRHASAGHAAAGT